ncbi:MAG: Tex-like N-terminal domain-containing protein, partial [Planctomycetota bacterium]
MSIDLAAIGRELKKPVENIESAVKLLDEGNTIPFVTRFRKDQTGGLTEEQLATIKTSVAKLRALAERKAFISKSIESQGKLNEGLSEQIDKAGSSRELEDIYLPFKAKKQTLATVARQNGLEPLALDVFEGREPEKDLASRATDFVRVDKDLNSVDEVIAGVGYILAEKFSDHSELRNELRSIMSKGKLTTKLIEVETAATTPAVDEKVVTEKDDENA